MLTQTKQSQYNVVRMIQNASLDTSFWNVANRVGVVPYLFQFFRVHYCQAVEREIVTTDPAKTTLIYPQAMMFNMMRDDGHLHYAEPKQPLDLFGRGEASAVALALERDWFLLLNDLRPLRYAESLGIDCMCVPDFCVLLHSSGLITRQAAIGYMKRLSSVTSYRLIEEAMNYLEGISPS